MAALWSFAFGNSRLSKETQRNAHEVVIANAQDVLADQAVLPQTQNGSPKTRLNRALGLVDLNIDLGAPPRISESLASTSESSGRQSVSSAISF